MKEKSLFAGLKSFLILWSSQAVSELGTAMTNFALVIWVYGQVGSASSLTALTVCSFLPTILFRFIAGTLVDRWDKKRVMLAADLVAACGTAAVLVLYTFGALRVWQLYIINALLSLMNAFQNPAASVATSLLVPREQYTRVGGLQAFSGSIVTILAPALGSALLALGGMEVVLLFDLTSFALAFLTLGLFIKIPAVARKSEPRERFLKDCATGIRYLRAHAPLLRIILFFTLINFLAKLGGDGMMSPFVLGRTGGDQRALGLVQTAVALGVLAGSLVMMLMQPARRRTRVIFGACALIFACNVAQGLTRTVPAWCAIAFVTYATAAVMNTYLTATMRTHVPPDMQGRVFSAKDTIQNCAIPLGLLLGGALADRVFEPLMAGDAGMRPALAALLGTGGGAGIALMFCCVGVIGFGISITRLRKPVYRALDGEPIDK